ncbi:phosphate signaling complex protein PhoU [Micrococcoides hystricis]|uniref:Phosphate-specific transport system accessory protein PhoU n=1 Tax=Micrococcoides hystricis TaxID=1572761 RepID=A0ABV6PAZ0_9MICC
MRKIFQADLEALGDQLVEISQLVSTAMERAYESFDEADLELAERVIADDARIDFLQLALDEKAIELLALQGPVATDLRTVVAALRMSSSLERMGDLARHISQLARLRYPENVAPASIAPTFKRMAQLCISMAQNVTALLESRELDLAKQIVKDNMELNELHSSVFAAIADPSWDADAPSTVDCTLASRYFERYGDHAVSVARKVSYLVTGEWESTLPGI